MKIKLRSAHMGCGRRGATGTVGGVPTKGAVETGKGGYVVVNLDCQLGGIYNHHRNRPLELSE